MFFKQYPVKKEDCTHPRIYDNKMINRRCCPDCGFQERLTEILCPKCKTHEMDFSRTCGVMVCINPECRQHESPLSACFCGWNTHLLDPHEDNSDGDFFDPVRVPWWMDRGLR